MFSRKSHVRDHLKLHISSAVSSSQLEDISTPVIKSEVLDESSPVVASDDNHVFNDVLGSPVLSCALCSFTTGSLQELKEHLSVEHTDEISFVTELNEIVESSVEDCDASEDNEEEEMELQNWDEMEAKPDVAKVMSSVNEIEKSETAAD